ncbi:4Fe-4S binding protein [Desulfitobacterium hafniense]|nr:4Fe-4S binding protein [Desulfitobacterium hafniense]
MIPVLKQLFSKDTGRKEEIEPLAKVKEPGPEKELPKNRARTLRMTSMAAVMMLVFLGGIAGMGTGSLSSFGVKSISAMCPLGSLEVMLASRTFLPRVVIVFLAIAGLTVLLGRFFCGWICPVPLVRNVLTKKSDEKILEQKSSAPGLAVLGASLASSAVFGFPVFCLVCPVGLIFATLFALTRLLQFNEPTSDLIVFPLIIIIELVFLKKWCGRWCPMGALLGLFSRFNRRLVPTVDRSLCLEDTRNAKCRICRSTCSLDIDLKDGSGAGELSDCTKCRECAANCPVQAIHFPWQRKRSS